MKYLKYGILILIVVIAFSYLFSFVNWIKLEPGKNTTIWVQSQNGNDNAASLNIIKGAGSGHAKLKYTVEKFVEIGIIALPDVSTVFSPIFEGTKLRDFKTAPFIDGLTIIDHNKTSYMNGVIKYWKVVSKEDENEVRIAIFRYSFSTNKYTLINSSPIRVAQKGLNEFYEDIPIVIKQNDVLGLIVKKPIFQNRIFYNELSKIITLSGFKSNFDKSEAVEDSVNGSFSFSALLSAGKEIGEVFNQTNKATVINVPLTPIYGHLAWYKFTFFPETGEFYLKPGIVSLLLNANAFIGLIQENSNPWAPQSFSLMLAVLLTVLFLCTARLISLDPHSPFQMCVSIASILIIFCLTRYLASSYPGLQYITIVATFLMILLIPGVIISRYYPSYVNEFASGRIILAFVISLVYWLIPALGLFIVKVSYWPVIVATMILVVLIFLKQPVLQKREIVREESTLYWKTFQFVLWGVIGLLAVHTFFSSRFHAERFDTFHHLSLAAKCFDLPIAGDIHSNLYGLKMSTIAPYSYNIWGLLVGMAGKVSGFDIGTIYCIGSGLLVLLMFITQWWLIGLFVKSEKIKISAFAVILMIYVTRTLATFAVIFQRSEFVFIMYGPSVLEFFLYAVYIVLGIRVIHSKRSADLLVFFGLSLTLAFFHLEFIFFNTLVLFLLIVFSLRENTKFRFSRRHAYLLAIIILLGTVGFFVKSRLALGSFIDASSPHYPKYYGLRYEQYSLVKRFYYVFKDLFKFIHLYIWNIVAVWGGLLLVIFPGKNISIRMFNAAYCIIMVMLLISYNPISEVIFTPLLSSWPLQRIEIYLRAIMFIFAAIVISVSLFRVVGFFKKHVTYIKPIAYALPGVVLLLLVSLTYKQWLPQIISTVYTVTYNQGNYLDITNLANLPEFKFLNKYSKGKYAAVLVEEPYSYAIPSLSAAYSYFHHHYPHYDAAITRYNEREEIWKGCLNEPRRCKDQLPKDSLLLVRNENSAKFIKIGYVEIYKGRLYTIIRE